MLALTKEHANALSAPFSKEKLSVKVQSLTKDRKKAMLVVYLQHTDVAARLDEVDPAWSCHVLDRWVEIPTNGKGERLCYVRLELTILGCKRENVGDGEEWKSAWSDALKRAAMLFGVGRDLYDQGMVWVPYDEQEDRYKTWTYDQYLKLLRNPADDVSAKPEKSALKEPKEPMKLTPPKQTPESSTQTQPEKQQSLIDQAMRKHTMTPQEIEMKVLNPLYVFPAGRFGGLKPMQIMDDQLENYLATIDVRLKEKKILPEKIQDPIMFESYWAAAAELSRRAKRKEKDLANEANENWENDVP